MRYTSIALLTALLLLAACSSDGGEPAVAFEDLSDGDTVTSPVEVSFDVTDFEVEEAGEVVDGAGHMHVMVNTPCVTPGEVIPSDDAHLHYGDGSTSTTLELEPGEYSLCLQAGDGAHTALDLTDEVSITVE
ncbi:DUF4399 domain-containing protein [Euzebya tangerina]|uniref:DUF4399 domain-containing protein n=1 Tax=Euzebya tangerina TaxID=591198 RepID=UPI00196A2DAE|nr:DUF4399 domain-containing protein [Euzebya tangerina]